MKRADTHSIVRIQNNIIFGDNPGTQTNPQADEQTEVADEVKSSWKVILFNDDHHTFDQVIYQIIKATGCSIPKAEELTNEVHFKGKAMVYEGDFMECLRVSAVLQEIELITEIEG